MAHQEEEEEQEERLNHTNYKILCEIGSSVRSVVYKAIFLPKNSVVAIKAIDLDQSRDNFEDIVQVTISRNLSHPNLLKPHCSIKVDGRFWIVMPFISTGSLQSIVSSSFPNGLPELCISLILKQVLNALSYLHNEVNNIHGDIKSGNIFIDSNGVVKLSDFGFSTSLYNSDFSATSPYWVPPEVTIHNSQINKRLNAHDIWAFGVTALELAYGGPPLSYICSPVSKSLLLKIKDRFQFLDCSDIQNQIKKDKNNNNNNKNFSIAFEKMVASCLNQDPSERPTVEQLLNFPFFKNNDLGVQFLKKNVFLETPNIEKWFKESNQGRKKNEDSDINEDKSEIQKAKSGRNIIVRESKEDGFELDRVSARSAVVESDESMSPSSLSLHERSDEVLILDNTYCDELIINTVRKYSKERNKDTRELFSGIKDRLDDGRSIERDAVIGILFEYKDNLMKEREQVLGCIKKLGGDVGWDVYKELGIMAMRSERQKVENQLAMTKLENEKMKNNDLELENVKLKSIIDDLKKSHELELENEKDKITTLELELEFLRFRFTKVKSAGGLCEESD